jgi:hypothetical protein
MKFMRRTEKINSGFEEKKQVGGNQAEISDALRSVGGNPSMSIAVVVDHRQADFGHIMFIANCELLDMSKKML